MLSRVADSLYWAGRYLERAEHASRLIEMNLGLMLDEAPDAQDGRWTRILTAMQCPADIAEGRGDDAYAAVDALTFHPDNPNSIKVCIAAARENARQVREQVATDVFEHLNGLYLRVKQTRLDSLWSYQPDAFFRRARQGCILFHGLLDATVPHGEEWLFVQLGRYIERAQALPRLLKTYIDEDDQAPDEHRQAAQYLHWVGLLKSCEAFMPYLNRYRSGVTPRPIAEFLLLDASFPRSARYAADMIQHALASIARHSGSYRSAPLDRLAGRLQSSLNYAQIDEIMQSGLHRYLDGIVDQTQRIHHEIYRVYIAYPIEEVAV